MRDATAIPSTSVTHQVRKAGTFAINVSGCSTHAAHAAPAATCVIALPGAGRQRLRVRLQIEGEDSISVDGRKIRIVSNRDPTKLPWGEMDVDLVIEGTGVFVDPAGAGKHIQAGAKKVRRRRRAPGWRRRRCPGLLVQEPSSSLAWWSRWRHLAPEPDAGIPPAAELSRLRALCPLGPRHCLVPALHGSGLRAKLPSTSPCGAAGTHGGAAQSRRPTLRRS